MVRIVEIKEEVISSNLLDNIYEIKEIVQKLEEQLELIKEMNKDDYNYLELIIEKVTVNLKKAYIISKF